MHMADALISPAVGGTLWAVTVGMTAYSAKKIKYDMDEKKIPLMGVMGAFIFAAQMINFSIPGTGSSGHLGGGMLLAILLGPYAGFMTMMSILLIQALFFADGGLLALGCNIINLGFYTCFAAYPFIYRKILRKGYSRSRIFWGTLVSAVTALQLGAFSVVLETLLSGKSELPFGTFLSLMQPIHLAIGVIEGLVTAAIVTFVWRARPEIIEHTVSKSVAGSMSMRKVLITLAAAAIVTGGFLSWFASSHPDGLEWAMMKTSGSEELTASDPIHNILAAVQEKTAVLPGYGLKASTKTIDQNTPEKQESWPVVKGGTSLSGLIGGAMTLSLALIAGFGIHLFKKKRKA